MTPFEKVMVVAKQAEMLIDKVKHDGWTFYTEEGLVDYCMFLGTYLAVSKDAAEILRRFFVELKEVKVTWVECTVQVECEITLEEKIHVDKTRSQRGQWWRDKF